ncbi:hypothetical protein EMIT0P12_10079 [Pseudomonas sp. IT-P12]
MTDQPVPILRCTNHQTQTITRRSPGPVGNGTAKHDGVLHFTQQRWRKQLPGQQLIQQSRGLAKRAGEQSVIHPARVIGGHGRRVYVGQILPCSCKPDPGQTQGQEHSLSQRLFQTLPCTPLNQSGHLHVSHVGIPPRGPRWIAQPGAVKPLDHFGGGPGLPMFGNGGVVVLEFRVISKPRLMLEELAQGEWALLDWVVKSDNTIAHKRQRCCCQHRFGETPPWDPDVSLRGRRGLTIERYGPKHSRIS